MSDQNLQQTCNKLATDCISRRAAIDAVAEGLKHIFVEYRDVAEKMLNKVPPAQPERKKGKWKITNLGAVGVFDSCSECKRVVKHKAPFYNYCPNCGADMRGEKNE